MGSFFQWSFSASHLVRSLSLCLFIFHISHSDSLFPSFWPSFSISSFLFLSFSLPSAPLLPCCVHKTVMSFLISSYCPFPSAVRGMQQHATTCNNMQQHAMSAIVQNVSGNASTHIISRLRYRNEAKSQKQKQNQKQKQEAEQRSRWGSGWMWRGHGCVRGKGNGRCRELAGRLRLRNYVHHAQREREK